MFNYNIPALCLHYGAINLLIRIVSNRRNIENGTHSTLLLNKIWMKIYIKRIHYLYAKRKDKNTNIFETVKAYNNRSTATASGTAKPRGMYPKTNLQSQITLFCIRGSDICAGSAAQYISRHQCAAPCEIIIMEVSQYYCSKELKIN